MIYKSTDHDEEDILNSMEQKPLTQSEKEHYINMLSKDFIRKCEECGIPAFLAYYLPIKGYRYKAIFPEEIDNENVQSEYGKFNQFLKVCLGFNRKDYETTINTN